MPPKKKARHFSRAASSISKEAQDELLVQVDSRPTSGGKPGDPSPELVTDAWTDEQEISLFKGMIRWKPVGMHKHFRMIALSQYLRNHGYNPSKDRHTGIPGIWQKLASLYNLDALDEREDSIGDTNSDSNNSSSPSREPFADFSLPKDFEELMFAKRLAPTGSSSPFSVPNDDTIIGSSNRRRPSTIDDSEEPRSSPASHRGTRSGRGTRTAKGSGPGPRRSGLHTQITPGKVDKESKTSTGKTSAVSSSSSTSSSSENENEEQEDEDEEEEEEKEKDKEDETNATREGKGKGKGRNTSGRRRGRGQGQAGGGGGRWGKGTKGRGGGGGGSVGARRGSTRRR